MNYPAVHSINRQGPFRPKLYGLRCSTPRINRQLRQPYGISFDICNQKLVQQRVNRPRLLPKLQGVSLPHVPAEFQQERSRNHVNKKELWGDWAEDYPNEFEWGQSIVMEQPRPLGISLTSVLYVGSCTVLLSFVALSTMSTRRSIQAAQQHQSTPVAVVQSQSQPSSTKPAKNEASQGTQTLVGNIQDDSTNSATADQHDPTSKKGTESLDDLLTYLDAKVAEEQSDQPVAVEDSWKSWFRDDDDCTVTLGAPKPPRNPIRAILGGGLLRTFRKPENSGSTPLGSSQTQLPSTDAPGGPALAPTSEVAQDSDQTEGEPVYTTATHHEHALSQSESGSESSGVMQPDSEPASAPQPKEALPRANLASRAAEGAREWANNFRLWATGQSGHGKNGGSGGAGGGVDAGGANGKAGSPRQGGGANGGGVLGSIVNGDSLPVSTNGAPAVKQSTLYHNAGAGTNTTETQGYAEDSGSRDATIATDWSSRPVLAPTYSQTNAEPAAAPPSSYADAAESSVGDSGHVAARDLSRLGGVQQDRGKSQKWGGWRGSATGVADVEDDVWDGGVFAASASLAADSARLKYGTSASEKAKFVARGAVAASEAAQKSMAYAAAASAAAKQAAQAAQLAGETAEQVATAAEKVSADELTKLHHKLHQATRLSIEAEAQAAKACARAVALQTVAEEEERLVRSMRGIRGEHYHEGPVQKLTQAIGSSIDWCRQAAQNFAMKSK